MNLRLRSLLAASGLLLALAAVAQPSSAPTPYKVAGTYHVGGAGGWDYVVVDSENQLLYVPRTSHTLVLKADTGAVVADIGGQKRNHGVALTADRGFITDGADASVVIFDRKSNAVLGKVKVQPDADGIIYDAADNKVLLVCGDAGVLIPIAPDVDPKNGAADPAIELGGKPEFLAADGRGKVYVNLVDKDQVAVVDLKTGKVTAHWPTAPGGSPVGMAIDPAHRRLFVGCRNPHRMVVLDCDSGKVVADLPIGRGVDAVVFDDAYALASCGDGTLTVVGAGSDDKFSVVQTVTTRASARTAGVDPRTHTVYLPAADMLPANGKARPQPKPDSFEIIKVTRSP